MYTTPQRFRLLLRRTVSSVVSSAGSMQSSDTPSSKILSACSCKVMLHRIVHRIGLTGCYWSCSLLSLLDHSMHGQYIVETI
jgi:hypothetical protein